VHRNSRKCLIKDRNFCPFGESFFAELGAWQGTLLLALFRLIDPGTYPPGADLPSFCPWSTPERAHQGQICRIFAPGQPRNVPTRGRYAGFLPLVLLTVPLPIS